MRLMRVGLRGGPSGSTGRNAEKGSLVAVQAGRATKLQMYHCSGRPESAPPVRSTMP